MPLPLAASPVEAGFPSPAEDFMDGTLDLNKYLIRNRPATFFAVVHGLSMVGEGIDEGDLLSLTKASSRMTDVSPCASLTGSSR